MSEENVEKIVEDVRIKLFQNGITVAKFIEALGKDDLKSIKEVIDMGDYFIPDYQRGYRWKREHVRSFLEDISNLGDNQINCIQPLVVKNKSEKNNTGDKQIHSNVYTVIDGQQRLTTIYIILAFLSEQDNDIASLKSKFKIAYQRYQKADEQYFLENLNGEISESDAKAKVDFYHMWMAYDEVKKYLYNEDTRKKFVAHLLNQTMFIWYNADEKVDEDEKEIFSRLNTGKIILTDAELIRALFLSRSASPKEDRRQKELLQIEIANEWSFFENTLRIPEFWGFINGGDDLGKSPNDSARITLLFALLKQESGSTTFSLYNAYQKAFDASNQDITTMMREEWEKIRELFYCLYDWYTDLELYHYVGCYLSICGKDKLKNLCEKWRPELFPKTSQRNDCTRNDFVKYICEEMFRSIFVEKRENNDEIAANRSEIVNNYINNVAYNNTSRDKIRSILLIHNVQTTIQIWKKANKTHTKSDYFDRFPFHFFNATQWDIEHIDSQHKFEPNPTKANGEIPLANKLLLAEFYNCLNDSEIKIRLRDVLKGNSCEDVNKLIQDCEESLPKKDDTSKTDDSEKHKLKNLTLLDMSTNREYKDSPFMYKRMVILARMNGKKLSNLKEWDEIEGLFKEEEWDESEYSVPMVPICASRIFTKYYTPYPKDLLKWGEVDQKNYIQDMIEKVSDFFQIKTDTSKLQ